MKPENILLDIDGYIRLTDFGLAKIVKDRTQSLCGTLEYLAPEVLFGEAYNHDVDWWAFGIVLFEMLTGIQPYYTSNREDLVNRIKYDPVKLPKQLSTEVKALLTGLLSKDPSKRFKAAEIKAHPWFAKTPWDALVARQVKPPWVPKLKNDFDVSNFAKVLEHRGIKLTSFRISPKKQCFLEKPVLIYKTPFTSRVFYFAVRVDLSRLFIPKGIDDDRNVEEYSNEEPIVHYDVTGN